ncbi:serine O-acetyltransferase EpsC [Niabella beijingensis]|uniref:serine O-acetyltransferase EpsC n=1 Tax=Niabella beijingensis TaxID=2872700 RepID=UPI001CBACE44|nr:serine O-acetyltransferase EpsC [Niabella beijingensis]MBZ4189845.1 serine O-acetyltransferase [Niabella beijingensis]
MSEKDFLSLLQRHNKKRTGNIPDKALSHQFVDDIFGFLFVPQTGVNQKETDLEKGWYSLKSHLTTLVYDVVNDGTKAQALSDKFFKELPGIYETLQKDASFFLANDPAALNKEEVLHAYPGFYAIAVYRISNQLWKLGIGVLPRILTEYAHSKTGIDIHPGATIGSSFFIDHGTGVVIGETAVIGEQVKIYQGVTIGALNSAKVKKDKKRHPTVEDNVIIYSGATILGGDTVIGKDSVIGGNAWITFSVPPASLVYHKSEVVEKEHFSHKNSVKAILKK